MKELELEYYFKEIGNFTYKEVFQNCRYPWEALAKIKEFVTNFFEKNENINKATIGDFCSIEGNHFIDEGTKIHSNVSIEGPVIIGKNVEIQSGALIRPYSIIGDNAVVGHCCEVKHSIVQNKAKVQSFTFIGDSIIGKSTRVGSGTILANRRFDQKNITVKIDGEVFDTNTDFFGAIVGDNSRLGANSVTVPGSFVGPYTWILPTVQVRGFIPAEKRIMPKAEYKIVDNPKIELK